MSGRTTKHDRQDVDKRDEHDVATDDGHEGDMVVETDEQVMANVDPTMMHPDIAGDWPLWSRVVESAATARLAALEERFPELTAAVLATADGLHIASHGIDIEVADRLAAMNASLFGVARAEAEVVAPPDVPSLSAVVSVTIGSSQVALLSFVLEPFGQLLLSVAAEDVQLGTVIVQARTAAADLRTGLGHALPVS